MEQSKYVKVGNTWCKIRGEKRDEWSIYDPIIRQIRYIRKGGEVLTTPQLVDYLREEEEEKEEPKENYYELWPGTEAIDVIKASLTEEEYRGFLKGNILKYQLRKGNKPGEPLEKDQEKLTHYKQILKESL